MIVLSLEFMRLALVSAVLVGLVAPAVGVFLVQRRLALMGDGIGHVALTGVALGFLLGTAPVLTAVVVAMSTPLVWAGLVADQPDTAVLAPPRVALVDGDDDAPGGP